MKDCIIVIVILIWPRARRKQGVKTNTDRNSSIHSKSEDFSSFQAFKVIKMSFLGGVNHIWLCHMKLWNSNHIKWHIIVEFSVRTEIIIFLTSPHEVISSEAKQGVKLTGLCHVKLTGLCHVKSEVRSRQPTAYSVWRILLTFWNVYLKFPLWINEKKKKFKKKYTTRSKLGGRRNLNTWTIL